MDNNNNSANPTTPVAPTDGGMTQPTPAPMPDPVAPVAPAADPMGSPVPATPEPAPIMPDPVAPVAPASDPMTPPVAPEPMNPAVGTDTTGGAGTPPTSNVA